MVGNKKWNHYVDLVDECSNPDCVSYAPLEIHHIIPTYVGGNDDFNNVIVLCRDCHRKRVNGLHTDWMVHYDKLCGWKDEVDGHIPHEPKWRKYINPID